MLILDTNVVSALMLRDPDVAVIDWLNRQRRDSVWTTSITVFEVRYGILCRETGKKQDRLIRAFAAFLDLIRGRVAPFDMVAAEEAARVAAMRKRKGTPRGQHDTLIAGIVLGHTATLATRNTADFNDLNLPLVNPWA